jgi:hypothetical protein
MFSAELCDKFLELESRAEPGIELSNADFDVPAQLGECLDPLSEFPPELFLRSFRKACSFGHGERKRFPIEAFYHGLALDLKPMVNQALTSPNLC